MTTQILAIVGAILAIIVGLWNYLKRKNEYKRQQAEQAKKDLDNANKNNSPSDFIDGFGRL